MTRSVAADHADLMNETHSSFSAGGQTYAFHDVRAALGADAHARLPYVARVLAENLLAPSRPAGRDARSCCARSPIPRVAPDTRRAAVACAARRRSGFLGHSGADGPCGAALGGGAHGAAIRRASMPRCR